MFGRGNKERDQMLRDILHELRRLNAVWAPTEPVEPTPSVTVAPVGILDRPLARDTSITLKESLLKMLHGTGQSLDSIASSYVSFARGDLEYGLDLLVASGDLTCATSRTTVAGVSANRVIYRGTA